MSLSPRAIAMQGLGFAALLIAAQGFVTIDVVLTPIRPPTEGVNLLAKVSIEEIHGRRVALRVTVNGEDFYQAINIDEIAGSVESFEMTVSNRLLHGAYSVKVSDPEIFPKRFIWTKS